MTLAVGAWGNDDILGYVKVYHRKGDEMNWSQLAQSLNNVAAEDYSGDHVALSGDGKTLAIGATFGGGNGKGSAHVRVLNI